MDLYLIIARKFLIREIWLKYNKYLDYDFIRQNFPEVFKLFQVINRLQEATNGDRLTEADVLAGIQIHYPGAKDSHILLRRLWEIAEEAPAPAIDRLLEVLRDRARASEIAYKAYDVAEGKADVQELRQLTTAFSSEQPSAGQGEEFVEDDLEKLYDSAVTSAGLKWRLASLNKALGPLRKGDFGFVFARPESGKTTFVADQATYMAEQCTGPVLWINNEEQGEKVKLRLYEASLGARLAQLEANKQRAYHVYLERTGGRIKLKDDATISKERVEAICRELRPELIVIDQLDKVRGFDADRDDLKLGSIYQWARELAKAYAPVIGVCQADGSAEGVKFLHMGHVANAKTSKQAEADWILGIGYSFGDPARIRGFSICKNKLLGGPDSIPDLRHGKFEVLLEPEIARYKDIV